MEISEKIFDNGNLIVNTEYADILYKNGIKSAKSLWDMESATVKNAVKSRSTETCFLETAQNTKKLRVYIKRCEPPTFKEKVLAFCGIRDIFDSIHEWKALKLFLRENIPVPIPVAAAKYEQCTCIMTVGIEDYTRASEVFKQLKANNLKIKERKRNLIRDIAEIAAKMHLNRFAHQDFYLVHLFIKEKEKDKIYLIDLQRAILKSLFFRRWMIKDLGQLLFSAREFVSMTDMLFFWKIYTAAIGQGYYNDQKLLKAVFRKAAKIKRHHEKHTTRRDSA